MLDEIEELELVLDHYGITWGLGGNISSNWKDWGLKADTAGYDSNDDITE
jgi:hypothetical protein